MGPPPDEPTSPTGSSSRRPKNMPRRHTTRALPTTSASSSTNGGWQATKPTAVGGGSPCILDIRVPRIDCAKKMKFTEGTQVKNVIKETLRALVKATLLDKDELKRKYMLLRSPDDSEAQKFSYKATIGQLGLTMATPVYLKRAPE